MARREWSRARSVVMGRLIRDLDDFLDCLERYQARRWREYKEQQFKHRRRTRATKK